MTTNNLDSKDFVVCGSSCASYMDYFILNRVRDVDIFVMDRPLEEVIPTEGADVLRHISTSSCLEHLEERDGFQFLNKVDILVSMAVGGLRRMKHRDFDYVAILLSDLGMNLDELEELIYIGLPNMKYLTDEMKRTIVNNIPLMRFYVTCRIKEIRESLEIFKKELQL